MIKIKTNKIVLQHHEPSTNPTSEELAKVVMARMGLDPRKAGSTDKMFRTMMELYERSKLAHREKQPEKAVMTVEEMAMYSGITRQTMYDYLRRWLDLNMIVKTSYIKDNKVIIGYRLNGTTLEASYDKAVSRITKNLNETKEYIQQLQKLIKNEKISKAQRKRSDDPPTPEPEKPPEPDNPPEPIDPTPGRDPSPEPGKDPVPVPDPDNPTEKDQLEVRIEPMREPNSQ
ncbi:hypothetical protein ACFL0V_06410 [Nanoarchaeota archaeon]